MSQMAGGFNIAIAATQQEWGKQLSTNEKIAEFADIPADRPVLIAGPTACGKSELALRLAQAADGIVVNADALQVWSCWRVLSARPTAAQEAQVPHALYGHISPGDDYSVGGWLRDLTPIVRRWQAGEGPRPIIVGGTGLYLSALTEGLAEIPATPPEVRTMASARLQAGGVKALLAGLDARTAERIDRRNPMRVQRAWEVLHVTGRGLADWQDQTPPALLPAADCTTLLIAPERDWLAERIDRRFDLMLKDGALEEARKVLPFWDPQALWAKAIGAPELIDFLNGACDLETSRTRAQAATRQYAKRQRTWFRSRMSGWHKILRP